MLRLLFSLCILLGVSRTFALETRVTSTTCGGVLMPIESGEIIYKPDEQALPNERCIWTVSVENAIHQQVNITYTGFSSGHKLLNIAAFDYHRPEPEEWFPTSPEGIYLFQKTLFFVSYQTPNVTTPDMKGFRLEFWKVANSTSNLPQFTHKMIPPGVPYLKHPEEDVDYQDMEQSSFVFSLLNNTYVQGREKTVIYNRLGMEGCNNWGDGDKMSAFHFNAGSTSKAWNLIRRFCGDGPETELFRSDEVLLFVFLADASVTGRGFEFLIPQIP